MRLGRRAQRELNERREEAVEQVAAIRKDLTEFIETLRMRANMTSPTDSATTEAVRYEMLVVAFGIEQRLSHHRSRFACCACGRVDSPLGPDGMCERCSAAEDAPEEGFAL